MPLNVLSYSPSPFYAGVSSTLRPRRNPENPGSDPKGRTKAPRIDPTSESGRLDVKDGDLLFLFSYKGRVPIDNAPATPSHTGSRGEGLDLTRKLCRSREEGGKRCGVP